MTDLQTARAHPGAQVVDWLRSRFSAAALSRAAMVPSVQVGLFFCLVATLRLTFVFLYGVDLPYSDQWDSEGWNWLKPFAEGKTNWGALFLPHNEHRIVIVRLLSLGLFWLNNGQWDNLVATTLNVFFVACISALALRAMLRHLAADMWPLSMFLAAACCLPCGYENLLIGFQVQIYFLIALCVLGVWLAASRVPTLGNCVVIAVIAIVSLFTMASGLFTALAIGVAMALRAWTTRANPRKLVPMAVLLLVIAAAGTLLLVRVAGHQALQAQNICDWLRTVRLVGSWPLPSYWIFLVLVWSPLVLGGHLLVRRRQADPAGIAALSLGIWTWLQIASLGYGRAHDLLSVHSRYTDMLALTVLVNAYFCLRLAHPGGQQVRIDARVVLASAWLAMIVAGYAAQGAVGLVAMRQFGESRQMQSEAVRDYVRGGRNSPAIDSAQPWNLPYPDKQRLKLMLNDKTIRDILPASARPLLPVGPYVGGFSANGEPPTVTPLQRQTVYGSYAPNSGNENRADLTAELHTRFPWLRFRISGYLGSEGLDLSLAATDRSVSVPIVPPVPANENWATVDVRPPARDFLLNARDASSSLWFAFTAPSEIGRLSMWTQRLLGVSPALLFATLLAIYFLAQCRWLRGRVHAAVSESGLVPGQATESPPAAAET